MDSIGREYMKDRAELLKELMDFLNELNLKYNETPLSESQIAILNKRMASYDIYFRKVQEKNGTDPVTEPEKFLRLLKEVDHHMLLIAGEALGEYIVLKPKDPQQIPLSTFAHLPEENEADEKLKLSKIRVTKKGLNGHS